MSMKACSLQTFRLIFLDLAMRPPCHSLGREFKPKAPKDSLLVSLIAFVKSLENLAPCKFLHSVQGLELRKYVDFTCEVIPLQNAQKEQKVSQKSSEETWNAAQKTSEETLT